MNRVPIKTIPMMLPCGSQAHFDTASGISYRCEDCGAVVGSIRQPPGCKDLMVKYDNWRKLGGEGWDYFPGIEKYEHK